jgi:hypothetical protein
MSRVESSRVESSRVESSRVESSRVESSESNQSNRILEEIQKLSQHSRKNYSMMMCRCFITVQYMYSTCFFSFFIVLYEYSTSMIEYCTNYCNSASTTIQLVRAYTGKHIIIF